MHKHDWYGGEGSALWSCGDHTEGKRTYDTQRKAVWGDKSIRIHNEAFTSCTPCTVELQLPSFMRTIVALSSSSSHKVFSGSIRCVICYSCTALPLPPSFPIRLGTALHTNSYPRCIRCSTLSTIHSLSTALMQTIPSSSALSNTAGSFRQSPPSKLSRRCKIQVRAHQPQTTLLKI